jgi:hypothetical protein
LKETDARLLPEALRKFIKEITTKRMLPSSVSTSATAMKTVPKSKKYDNLCDTVPPLLMYVDFVARSGYMVYFGS